MRNRGKTPSADTPQKAQPVVQGENVAPKPKSGKASKKGGLSFLLSFVLLFSARSLSALFNPIADCDETFNYWEPTHYLMFGKGLQTWEYSPAYGLRSYLYILPHFLLGKIPQLLGFDKITIFYFIRVAIGAMSALCEAYFYRSVVKRFGSRIANSTLFFLIFSYGMFNASTSYLPSSFSMFWLLLAFGAWFRGSFGLAIGFTGAGIILGWPFCLVACGPMALHILYKYGLLRTLKVAIPAAVALVGLTMLVDAYYYEKLFLAPLNIMIYNTVGSSGSSGSELYGTEPWTFYFKNILLNFNVVAALALASPLLVINLSEPWDWLMYCSPFYLWFAFFSSLAHKEERFLYVVYPTLCLAGSLALETLCIITDTIVEHIFVSKKKNVAAQRAQRAIKGEAKSAAPRFSTLSYVLVAFVAMAVIVLSASRTVAIVQGYSAPFKAYTHLYKELELSPSANVCVGKEWFRFPSNFFLPNQVDLRFIRSNFTGQLPQPFDPEFGTKKALPNFNDQNREEFSRYTDLSLCDFVVDREFPGQSETMHSTQEGWDIVSSTPFLDAQRSPPLTRAFFIPGLSEQQNAYNPYLVLAKHKE